MVGGGFQLAFFAPGHSIHQVLPFWAATCWYAFLIGSAALAGVGAAGSRPILEEAGGVGITTVVAIYNVVLIDFSLQTHQPQGLGSAALFTALGLMVVIRMIEVRRVTKLLMVLYPKGPRK